MLTLPLFYTYMLANLFTHYAFLTNLGQNCYYLYKTVRFLLNLSFMLREIVLDILICNCILRFLYV